MSTLSHLALLSFGMHSYMFYLPRIIITDIFKMTYHFEKKKRFEFTILNIFPKR